MNFCLIPIRRMKFFVTLLFLIFLNSCSETNNFGTANLQNSDKIILEVKSEHRSKVDWINGQILNFRLYEDGYVEFDDLLIDSKLEKQIIAEEVKIIKQAKISSDDLQELKSLILSSQFNKLNSEYTKVESSCDAVPQVNVKTQNKNVKLNWCDNLTEPHNSPDLPKILTKIFLLNRKIRNETLNKEVLSP